MRRFLIWSGLSVVIGLVLAVSGVLAYNHFWARFQPVTLDRNQAQIQRLLDEASWVSAGGGDQQLYIIGFRDDGPTRAYEVEEADKLRAGGADVRVVMFARPDREGMAQSTPAERATIAELWLTRDWGLYQRWTAGPSRHWTAADLPPADGNLARSAVVEASRQFVSRLDELMRDSGVKPTWPMVIWRDRDGFLKACACADRRSWAFVRDDIGAPESVAADAVPADPAPPVMAPPAMAPSTPLLPGAPTQGLPYPNLTAPIPAPTQPQAQPQTPAPSQPQRPSSQGSGTAPPPSRLERPTPATPPRKAAPRPVQPEDTQFF